MVIVMVSDGPDVEQILFGLEEWRRGRDSASWWSPPQTRRSERFAERLAQLGVEFLDAPVTGGQKGAVEGTLTVMVGAGRRRSRGFSQSLRPSART